MPEWLRLTVLTPAEELLDLEEVAWVQAHLADGGGIGIYPGHAPLLAETVTAPLCYTDPLGEHTLLLEGGILQIDSDGVTVFTSGLSEPGEDLQPSPDIEETRFERLAQTLLATLRAMPAAMPELGDEGAQ
jgi:F-type H+-transporting ATPase subunit epsilon